MSDAAALRILRLLRTLGVYGSWIFGGLRVLCITVAVVAAVVGVKTQNNNPDLSALCKGVVIIVFWIGCLLVPLAAMAIVGTIVIRFVLRRHLKVSGESAFPVIPK